MKTFYITVMDYCEGCIKTYEHDFPEDDQTDEVESWLNEHTDYKSSQCDFMFKDEPIEVIEGEVTE